jgi:hypothetical protein
VKTVRVQNGLWWEEEWCAILTLIKFEGDREVEVWCQEVVLEEIALGRNLEEMVGRCRNFGFNVNFIWIQLFWFL